MNENSTVGTIFYYKDVTVPETPVCNQIYGLMTKPAMPGLPNKVSATSQEDTIEKSVAGARQLPDANFQFKYAKFNDTLTNFAKFRAMETAKTPVTYGIKYPDGKAVEFDAIPYVQRDGTGVGALDTFTVGMYNITGLNIDATAPATIVMVTGV